MSEPAWVDWARRLAGIAQNGLAFTDGEYDRLRYAEVREIAAAMLAAGGAAAPEVVHGFLERDDGYATPKVDVRGAVFRDGRLLLVREGGVWTLPGGWADVGDSPAASVVREVREEAGYETRATKLLALYDRSLHPHVPPRPWRIYKLFFRCELLSEQQAPLASETDAAEFFARDALPDLDLARVTPGQVERLFAHHDDPSLPPDFD